MRGANLSGPYLFGDAAAGNFWQAAVAAGNANAIPAGAYRTSFLNGTPTTMNTALAGLTSSQGRGLWTLRFLDWGEDDADGIASARLILHLVPE